MLPRSAKLTRGHHKALPYAEVPKFFATLAGMSSPASTALRFIILTAARSGEVRGMRWSEVDLKGAVWTVPATRMKAKRVHRVPLAHEALAILKDREPNPSEPDALVFPSARGRAMSDMAFAMLLRRSRQLDITTHGFRSSFRDWVDEKTDFSGALAEAALAHLVGNETERAYRRGDALEKRRQLMLAWATFATGTTAAEAKTAVNSS